jgi:peptide/nickel transport system permease protein
VLPHLIGPLTGLALTVWGALLLTESALTFLNLGVNPPEITWGGLLASGREYIGTAWWMIVFPGLAISIAMLGIVSASDWLRTRTGGVRV